MKRLADALEQVPGVRFTQRVESNQLFLTMPRAETDRMLHKINFFRTVESSKVTITNNLHHSFINLLTSISKCVGTHTHKTAVDILTTVKIPYATSL